MKVLEPQETNALKLIFSNALLDYVNGPHFRGLQATLITSLRSNRGYTRLQTTKVAIEIQCAALRELADQIEERSAELLRIAEVLDK
jgi:hypothetical protein